MKILSVEKFKGNTSRVVISNGEQSAEIYLNNDIIRRCGITGNMDIKASELKKIRSENDLRRAREWALYILDMREHSVKELYDKLIKKYPDEICRTVCSELEEKGILDDRRYAGQLFERYSSKYGRYRVQNELYRRGIDREIIDEVCEDFPDKTEQIKAFFSRKYIDKIDDRSAYSKIINAAVRRGYSYSEAAQALNELRQEIEEEQ